MKVVISILSECQVYNSSASYTLVLSGKELLIIVLGFRTHKYACE